MLNDDELMPLDEEDMECFGNLSEHILGASADEYLTGHRVEELEADLVETLKDVPCQICGEKSGWKIVVLVRSFNNAKWSGNEMTVQVTLSPRVACRACYREHRKDKDLDYLLNFPPPPLPPENV